MIKLRYDSRDKQYYQHFGQVIDFPDSLDFDTAQYDDVQPIGDIRCTCYTTCDIAEDQENRIFDIQDLWKRIPNSKDGADPRDVFQETIKNGLLPVGQTTRAKDWKSYWSALSGAMDYFDNVRSAIMKSQSPVSGAIFWCSEYANSTQTFEYKGQLAYVLPMGKTYKGGHMFSIEGWLTVNGEPMLIVEAWIGKKLLMPRDVFNSAMNKYGACSFVLSTNEMDEKIKLNILEKIKDACINVIILMKELLVEKQEVKKVDNPLPPQPQEVYNESKEELMKKYDWSTQEKARHSVRVICDEEGLSVKDKNDLCATVGGESNWNPRAIGKPNKNGSRDYGIVQLNDEYWIGEGKLYPNIEAVYNDPEGCIRWMCKQWAKNKNWWYAYKNRSYVNYLYPVFDKNGNLL